MAACASLHEEKADKKAQEYNIPKVCSINDLINDPQIDIILNLTVPEVHAKFNLVALEAEKHVFYGPRPKISEKPDPRYAERGAGAFRHLCGRLLLPNRTVLPA